MPVVPGWEGVAVPADGRRLSAGRATRGVERAESRALGVGTGVREESLRQRAGATLDREVGVGEEERPVWMECARCLQGGASAGVSESDRGTGGAAAWIEERVDEDRVGGSRSVVRVCGVRGRGVGGGRGCDGQDFSAGWFGGVEAWGEACTAWSWCQLLRVQLLAVAGGIIKGGGSACVCKWSRRWVGCTVSVVRGGCGGVCIGSGRERSGGGSRATNVWCAGGSWSG